MSRNLRESLGGGRNTPAISHYRRGHNLNGFSKDSDENLDLFSKGRRSYPLASPDDSSDVSAKLGRLSVGSIRLPKSRADDLLSCTDGGKHDYDWLLTPPGTPLGNESHSTLVVPKNTSSAKSSSTTKTSRLSVSQSESSYQSSRPARSSSVTRPSISTSQYSSYSMNRSPSSVLNTSSSSVSSYIRPSSPSTRSSSTARPSTPTRTSSSRASTPSRIRPGSSSGSSLDRTRPSSTSSRPSTPNSRAQAPSNSSTMASRPSSRPSTPTRRNPSPSVSASSGGRAAPNGRTSTVARPSSPGSRIRQPHHPITPPDFPLDTPPNLRRSLPDRPISAGRSRPSAATTAKVSPEPKGSSMTRRNPSPVAARGRLTETGGKGHHHVNGNGRLADAPESRRVSNVSDVASWRTLKSSASVSDSNGLGRSFSKNSLDMAIKHMDIRNGKGMNNRALPSTTLFPQSIRPASSKMQSIIRSTNNSDGGDMSENGGSNHGRRTETNEGRMMGKVREMDMYESSRYDALLLREDVKDMNWLHSIDDVATDQGLLVFDHLPEPFAPL